MRACFALHLAVRQECQDKELKTAEEKHAEIIKQADANYTLEVQSGLGQRRRLHPPPTYSQDHDHHHHHYGDSNKCHYATTATDYHRLLLLATVTLQKNY